MNLRSPASYLRHRAASVQDRLRRWRDAAAERWSRGKSGRDRGRKWIFGAVIFLGALVTVIALAPSEVEWLWEALLGGADSPSSWTKLEVEKPVALRDAEPRVVFVDEQPQWARSTLPQIDFTVRNEGTERVSLGRVRIEVTDSDRITSCEIPQGGEGGIPVVKSFSVGLPILPLPNERVIYRQLHQEVLPHRAARVRVYLHATGGALSNDPVAENLFALSVSLQADEPGQELAIGKFVLGLPKAVPRGGGFLPEVASALQAAATYNYLLPSTWCFRRNLAVVRRFLALPGARTPAMQSLSAIAQPLGWERLVDPRSAAEAVGPLLHGKRYGELMLEPVLALYAARQSGNRQLLTDTKRQADAIFRAGAEGSLQPHPNPGPEEGEIDARLLVGLEPSRANRLLLERTAAAVRLGEEAEAKARD